MEFSRHNINGISTEGTGTRQQNSSNGLVFRMPGKTTSGNARNLIRDSYTPEQRSVLNNTARTLFGKKGEDEATIQEPEVQTPDGLAWYNEFETTIADYLSLSDEEASYYQQMSSLYASQGQDPRIFGERFLTSAALSNTLGIDRNTLNANYDSIARYFLGSEEPISFSAGGRIINSYKTGQLYQKLYEKQDEYRDLFESGYDEDSAEVQAKQAEIDDIFKQIEHYGNSIPNNWLVTQLSTAVEQLPYMIKGGLGRIAGGLVGAGAGFMFPFVSVGMGWNIGSALGGFLTYQGGFKGNAFYEMKQNGVSTETALKASAVDGLINGANEALLDSVAGVLSHGLSLGKLKTTLFPSIFTKLAGRGSVGSFTGRLGLYLIGQGTGEFVQESTQSLTTSAIQSWAESKDGIAQSKTARDAVAQAIEEGIAGFTVGTIMGIPGSILATRADVKTVTNLADKAKTTPSREAFVKDKANRDAVSSMKLAGESFSEDAKSDALGSLYDNMAKARENEFKARAEVVGGSASTKEGKKILDNQEMVRRTKNGSIRTQVDLDETFGNTREMTISFGDTIAKKKDDKARSYGQMKVEFDSAANTAKITSLHIAKGFESSASEMVRTAISQYMQDYDVLWDTDNEFDSAIKENLINNNPDGIEQGLRYRATEDSRYAERIRMKNDIKSHFANLSEGEAMASAQIVDNLAESYGMTIQEFLDKYAGGTLFAEDKGNVFQGNARNARGAFRPLSAQQIAMGMKGVIYANDNADVSTFNHELFHFAVSLDKERRQNLTDAIRNAVKKQRDNLTQYIDDHREMFGDKTADEYVDILAGISDAEWTNAQEEAITSLYEAYLSDPNKIVSPDVKTVLDRIVDFMKRIYKSLKDNSLLNEDIANGFEEVMRFSVKENVKYQDSVYESEVSRLRKKYSSMVENPSQWDRKPVKEFFNAYKPQITEMLKEYPKVELEGVLMLEGMREADMPFQKELIQAKIISNILGSDVILLPRYATNTFKEIFEIDLSKGSISDGIAALVNGDQYIEFKLCGMNNFIQKSNETIKDSDIALIAIRNFAYEVFQRRLPNLVNTSDNILYFIDLNNGDIYEKNKENVTTLLMSSERIQGANMRTLMGFPVSKGYSRNVSDVNPIISRANGYEVEKVVPSPAPTPQNVSKDYERSALKLVVSNPHPFDSKYITDLEKVNPDALLDYDTYLSANKTDVKYQTAYHGSPYSFERFDTSKINTGEGAQYFGWGLYVTSSEDIARDYAERLGRRKEDIDSDIQYYKKRIRGLRNEIKQYREDLDSMQSEEYWQNNAEYQSMLDGTYKPKAFQIKMWNNLYGEGEWTLQDIANKRRADRGPMLENTIARKEAEINDINVKIRALQALPADGHHLYTINIPDRNFLQWDKPVSDSQAGRIWKELKKKNVFDVGSEDWDRYEFNQAKSDGESMYLYLSKHLNGDKEASLFLDSIGFKGINYPADTMSGKKSKDRNFVIFNDKNIQIDSHIKFQSSIPSDFNAQLEAISRSDIGRRNETIVFSTTTPVVFQELGFPNLSVEMYKDKLARGLFLEDSERHGHKNGLDKDIIKQVADKLADPLFVFKSATRDDSIVSVYPVKDRQGNPVIASLATSLGAKQNIEINLISSIYGRPSNQLQNWVDKGLLLYWNDLEELEPTLSVRLQLPSDVIGSKSKPALTVRLQLPSGVTGYNQNVLLKSELVKEKISYQNARRRELRQPLKENSYEEAIRLAQEAHPQFVSDIEKIKNMLGLADSAVSVRKKFKGEERATQKALSDYDGDFGLNLDYDGAMLNFSSIEDAEDAWNKVKQTYEDRIVKSKRLETESGYKDFKISLRMDNGFINEVQFLDSNMLAIKNTVGHKLYEISRNLDELIRNGYKEFESLRNAIIRCSIAEYGSAKDFVDNREAYTRSNARRFAVSSVITQALSSALSKYHLNSLSVNGRSITDLPSEDGISLKYTDELYGSLLNGISLISVNTGTSNISTSNSTVLSKSDNVKKKLRYQFATGEDGLEMRMKLNASAKTFDTIETFMEYYYKGEDEPWPLIFEEDEAVDIFNKAHTNSFYNKTLKSDKWLTLDVMTMSATQRDELFKQYINTDDGLDDFVTILRAGKRYFEDAGHWDIVSEAYGSGKMTRKRKWFAPVASMEDEAKIYDLASKLNDEIQRNAFNYTYARELNEKTRKSARTNILNNTQKYQELLSKVFKFFYQESYLMNQLYMETGQELEIVHDEYLSLSEAWSRTNQETSDDVAIVENIEGRRLNPEASIQGDNDINDLVDEDDMWEALDIAAEDDSNKIDTSLFPVDTSQIAIDKMLGSDDEKDIKFIESLDDTALLGALENIAAMRENGNVAIDQRMLEIAEDAARKSITEDELMEARTIIENAPRHYRDLLGNIFNRDDMKVSSSESEMPAIETADDVVESSQKGLNAKGRRNLVTNNLNQDTRESIETGSEKLVGGASDEALRQVTQELSDMQSQKEDVERRLRNAQAKVRRLRKNLEKAKSDSVQDKKHISELEHRLAVEQKKVETREKWLKDYKEAVRKKEALKRDLERIRSYKLKLARSLTRKWNKNVDYRTVMPLLVSINQTLDAKFVKEWLYDPVANPDAMTGGATTSFAEVQKLYSDLTSGILTEEEAGIHLEELKERVGMKVWNRLVGSKKPLNDWTIKELEDLNDKLNIAWKEGKEIQEQKELAKRTRRHGYINEIVETIKGMKSYKDNEKNALPGSSDLKDDSFKSKLRGFRYQVMRMQELAMRLDGDNGEKGDNYHLLVERVRNCQNIEANAIESRVKPISVAMDKIGKDSVMQFLYGYEHTFDFGSFSAKYNGSQLGYIYLSQFNEKARSAVAYGMLLSDKEKGTYDEKGELKPSIGVIANDEILKQTGDERYKKAIAVAEQIINEQGMMPVIEAIRDDLWDKSNGQRLFEFSLDQWNQPVVLEENYLPIRRMDALGDDEIKEAKDISMASGNYLDKIKDGFLKEKINFSPRNQKNVNMDLFSVWSSSVVQQEHLLSTGSLLSDINFVYERRKEVRLAITQAFGREMLTEIDDYLHYVADPEFKGNSEDVGKFLSFLRGSTAMGYLSWKISGILTQLITSPAPFLGETSALNLASSYKDMMVHPFETWDFVTSKSVMMKNRSANMIIQDMKERERSFESVPIKKKWQQFQNKGMLGLEWVDRYCVAGGWLAKYREVLDSSLANGLSSAEAENAAVKSADEMVLRTQPTGTKTELSRLFRSSNPVLKILLQFQSSMNVVWNNLTENARHDYKAFRKGNKEAMRRLIGHAVGYVASGMVLGMVHDGFDDDDDNKDKVAKIVTWIPSQFVESIPIVGSTVSSVWETIATGKYNPYSNNTVLFPALTDVASGGARMIAALSEEERDKAVQKMLKGAEQLSYGIGLTIGAPVSATKQVKRAVETRSLWPILGRY